MISLPWRIIKYISTQTLIGVLGLFFMLASLILLIDLIESLREVEKIENAGVGFAIKLTLLRAPKIALTLTPFIFLFGSMWAFYQMNRRSEIAVMRSVGLSVWEILSPAAMISFLMGLLILTFIDPLASDMSTQAELEKNELRGKKTSLLKSLQGGLWLKQVEGNQVLILHAESYDEKDDILNDVTLWKRTNAGVLLERWDADNAKIENQSFVLTNALLSSPDTKEKKRQETQVLTSVFNLDDLREDVAKPDTLSVWDLPDFIELAKGAGLPIVEYQMRYNDLIALPFKLFAMVLIAATFSMSPVRNNNTFRLIMYGIAAGFALFILSELSSSMAEAHVAPVWLAAWAPVVVAVLLSLTLLLHTEDG